MDIPNIPHKVLFREEYMIKHFPEFVSFIRNKYPTISTYKEMIFFPIRVEPQLHQHQERSMEQKAEQETRRTTGIADKSYQGVSRSQRPVEIESIYLSHSFGLGIWSMIFFTSHDRNNVATI